MSFSDLSTTKPIQLLDGIFIIINCCNNYNRHINITDINNQIITYIHYPISISSKATWRLCPGSHTRQQRTIVWCWLTLRPGKYSQKTESKSEDDLVIADFQIKWNAIYLFNLHSFLVCLFRYEMSHFDLYYKALVIVNN